MAFRQVALSASLLFCLGPATSATAQQKAPEAASALCTRDNALETAKQQILLTRTFDGAVPRITVLLRAADLLWPHEQEMALAAFMEAFELAVANFKESGDQVKRVSESKFAARIPVPDQRYRVLSTLAKRDPARARKLSEQILENDARDAADKLPADPISQHRAAEKILMMAHGLAATDPVSAAAFARQSFRFPATMYLSIFFYELAKTNKAAADQFYSESLNRYGNSPMDQFLYLSSYPFGNDREVGEMPGYTFYRVPPGYVPNRQLQQLFVQTLLTRSERALQMPVDAKANYRLSDQAQMWLALSRLEKQVRTETPALADSAARLKDALFGMLETPMQGRMTGIIEGDNAPKKSFDEQVEYAEKLTDVGRRDQTLTSAVTGLSKDQPADKVLSVIDKISDDNVRPALVNWFYYFRTQALITEKNLVEARKFASKVTELDQRAYLFTRIAEESLKVNEDQTEARELLNEIAESVGKAPKTIVSARALLALAYLYAKVDMNRGIEELGNAVRTINALESPDFSLQFVMMKIEGKTFGSYASFSTPGFNPENAFREMGKLDFDGSLTQATMFSDKSLRALTTLSVIEPCFVTKKKTRKT